MGNPTRKIKVKTIQVADPELLMTLESEDSGTFSPFVRVFTTMTWNNNNYPANGEGQPDGSGMNVDITAPFTDPNYGPNETMGYNITRIQFSDDNINWSDYTGELDGGSGTVNTGP